MMLNFVGIFSQRLVTLDSIDIFTTHEWFPSKPTVYFLCNGEDKVYLPDVKDANNIYTFKGEESWQVSQPKGLLPLMSHAHHNYTFLFSFLSFLLAALNTTSRKEMQEVWFVRRGYI